MWNSIFRTPAVTCFALLAAAALLAQAGCSGNTEGSAPPAGGTGLFPASQATGQNNRESNSDLTQPMLRAIDDALDEIPNADVEDLGTTKDEARSTLVEADKALTRIKEENRKALQRANNPPRRVIPPPPAPAPEEEPAPEE